MNDAFGRKVDYLRISVTDRCNQRCLYCLPEGYKGWEPREEHLTAEEIIRIVNVAAGLGFRKLRLTGGEPLVRDDLPAIVCGLKSISGVDVIGLSTNGTRLAALAQPLRAAGVRTVNVSLDALDPALYRQITGGDVAAVLAGIHAAQSAGFERIKLNCVLMRGKSEQEIWPLVLFAAEHELPLRLIELMPLSRTDVLDERNFLPVGEVMRQLAKKDELIPQPDRREGHGPAKYYRLKHTGALVGFIGALTNQAFCENCNKVRLTSDGKLRPCLGDHLETDLKPALRPEINDAALQNLFETTLRLKPAAHVFRSNYQPLRIMTAIGG
jgi:cyclic pyranopterin phosphate synthase